MLGTAVIVFREAIEAGLILGIVLAATSGVRHRALFVAGGAGLGLAGACVVALFAETLSAAFEGAGQELFNAGILLLAVGMLAWHNAWMATHGRELSRELKAVGAAVASGERSLIALALVCGLAVLREGAEIVLFLAGVAAGGGLTLGTLAAGAALGLAGGAAVSALIYGGLVVIPLRHVFRVTTALITLLAAGLAAQAIGFLHQSGLLEAMSTPLWDTSWLLSSESVAGRLMQTLIGYTDRPDGAQLLAYTATILGMILLIRLTRSTR